MIIVDALNRPLITIAVTKTQSLSPRSQKEDRACIRSPWASQHFLKRLQNKKQRKHMPGSRAVLHHPAVGHNSMDKQWKYRKCGIRLLRLLNQKLPRPWFSTSLDISVVNVRNAYCLSFAKLVVTVTPSGNDFHSRIVYAVLQTFLTSMFCSASPHFQGLSQQPAAKGDPSSPNISVPL